MSEVSNPLAAPAPDFTPPSANLEISNAAREYAQNLVGYAEAGGVKSRAPTDGEQVQRLSQAKEILGDRFWQAKAPAPPTAEQRAEADRATMLGINANAQASDFVVNTLPPDAPADTAARLRNFAAGLQVTKPYGDAIINRIVTVAREIGRMPPAEQDAWNVKQQRQIEEFGAARGWNVPEVKASVAKMLADKDGAAASIAFNDFETFVRLAMHVQNMKATRKA